MKVKLIAITKPVNDLGCEINTAQELVAYCARVSNPANQGNKETAEKLLKYMIENAHWSPFEMAHAVIEIETTRDIARQILRHRSFSFQEFSTRYSEVILPVNAELRECRLQDKKNRQNSIETNDEEKKVTWEEIQKRIMKNAFDAYHDALDLGIAKEQARSLLPEGLTPSRMYMAGSIRSWIHYIQLRAGNGTQKEHKLIAEGCKNIIVGEFPALEFVL